MAPCLIMSYDSSTDRLIVGFNGKVVGVVYVRGKVAPVLVDTDKFQHLHGNIRIMKSAIMDEPIIEGHPLSLQPDPFIKFSLPP